MIPIIYIKSYSIHKHIETKINLYDILNINKSNKVNCILID